MTDQPSDQPDNSGEETQPLKDEEARDLDYCPRCGEYITNLVWGQTNCPRCGLHFECC